MTAEILVPIITATANALIIAATVYFSNKSLAKRLGKRLGKLEDKVSKVENRFSSEINDIQSLLERLLVFLGAKENRNLFELLNTSNTLKPRPVQSDSPLKLTEKGREIAESTKAEQIVEKYYSDLIIPEDADKLGIQDACATFAFQELPKIITKEEDSIIREVAYQEGDIEDVLSVFSILLRDRVFQSRGIEIPQPTKKQ